MKRNLLLAAALCLHTLPAAADSPDSTTYTVSSNPSVDWVSVGFPQSLGGSDKIDIPLATPSVLYGQVSERVSVSRYGYIAWDDIDDGSDNTHDCPLPMAPSNSPNSETRLYPLHGNLSAGTSIFYNRIDAGSHSANCWGADVITWTGATLVGGTDTIDFQVLLFDDFEIVVQYRTTGSFGDDVTVGIQGAATGSEFLSVYCDQAGSITGDLQLRFSPPTLNAPGNIGGALLNSQLASYPEGTRVCFNSSGTAFGTGALAINKVIALVGFKPAPVTINSTTLSFPDYGAILGVNFSQSSVVGSGDLLIDGANFTEEGVDQGAVTVTDRLVVYNSQFDDCDATDGSRGGAIDAHRIAVRNCTFTGCDASGGGGGAIGCFNIFAIDCTFTNCTAIDGFGGAIRTNQTITEDCTFDGCSASGTPALCYGGAIYLKNSLFRAIRRSTFVNNTSDGSGGAIYADGENSSLPGRLTLEDCFFDGNSSDGALALNTGGGVALGGDIETTILRSLFTDNDGGTSGGGLSIGGTCSVEMSHSAFDGNSADSSGAIAHTGSLLDIRFCNIVRTTNNAAGGFAIGGDDSNIVTKYSIYADNTPPIADPASANFSTLGQNFVRTSAGGVPAPFSSATDTALAATGEIDNQPGGRPVIDSSYIDATDVTSTTAAGSLTDQRGLPRIIDGFADAGAYEYELVLVVNSTDDDPTFGGPMSLREAWGQDAVEILIDPSLDGSTITLDSPLPARANLIDLKFAPGAPADARLTIDGSAGAPLMFQPPGGPGFGEFNNIEGVRFTGFPTHVFELTTNGRLVATNCEFDANGAVLQSSGPNNFSPALQFTNCHFHHNGLGASPQPLISTVYCRSEGCLFELNRGTIFEVQGIASTFQGLDILNSSIVRNEKGVIHLPLNNGQLFKKHISIVGSTISSNAADGSITIHCEEGADIEFENSTIANNGGDTRAAGEPTGWCIYVPAGSTIAPQNSIFENNEVNFGAASSVDAVLISGGYNLFDDDIPDSALAATDREFTKAHLTPLGYYVRSADADAIPMPAHALLAISPAIDTGDSSASEQFGRGTLDGDSDGTATPDRGAFEAGAPIFVTSDADSGPGSLRQAIIDSPSGGRILFDGSRTVVLATDLNITKDLQIDATNHPGGAIIDGGGVTRAFDVQSGSYFGLHAFTLRNGAGTGNFSSGVRVRDGQATVSHCAIIDCSARRGAAAYVDKGGIYLMNCTITGNETTNSGGALDFLAGTENRIEHCTIALNYSDNGGALRFREGCLVHAKYNVFTQNFIGTSTNPGVEGNFFVGSTSSFPDRFRSEGYNWTSQLETAIDNAFTAPGDYADDIDATFGSLQFDGWSATLGIAAGTPGTFYNVQSNAPPFPTFDQRGYARVNEEGIDVGALEEDGQDEDSDSDGLPNYWEFLYGFSALEGDGIDDSTADPDGDGFDNLTEFLIGGDPLIADAPVLPEILSFGRSLVDPNEVTILLQGSAGEDYRFQSSTDLVTWTTLFEITTSSSPQSISQVIAPGRTFFRLATPDPE